MEINVHLLSSYSCKIQCWFPLDQHVRMDSQVQFVLRTEMLTGLSFPPGHHTSTVVYIKWFRKHFHRAFFTLCTAEKSILTCSFIQIIGLKYYVKLWWSPDISGWILWFFLKEGLPVCPRAAAGHSSVLRRAVPHHLAQGADVHTSWGKEGWLTLPQ